MAIFFLILFLIVPPGIFKFGKMAKDYLISYFFGRRKSSTAIRAEAAKEGINKKATKRIKFTFSDPRKKPIPFRLIFILIYLAGATVSFVGGLNGSWKTLLASFVIAYVALIFSIITANKIVTERDVLLYRMLDLKGVKMRYVSRDKGTLATPASEFRINEWSEDLLSPTKMYIYMPTDFDTLQIDTFLESFNLVFGGNGQWISDDTDKTHGGFDFNAGVAALRVSTPLPQMAMWHERYLDPKDIHWSYFPLALGSENGVPLYNTELERTEHVIGFAVNGGQEKLSKKNGAIIGNEITAAPQILIAGGTGGGKSLKSTTPVKVFIDE